MANIRVYHRTTEEEATRITFHGFRSKEEPPRVYVSTVPIGQNTGYGDVCLEISIDKALLELDDEFPDGEKHYAVPVGIMNRYGRIVGKF